jgi:hypothetical protein
MSCQVLIKNGLAEQPGNSQYPAFHLSHRALDWLQEGREAAFVVGAPKPRSDAVGVMLVTGCGSRTQKPRLHGLGWTSAIAERPTGMSQPSNGMYALTDSLPNEAQPGNSSVGGLRHRSPDVEMKKTKST